MTLPLLWSCCVLGDAERPAVLFLHGFLGDLHEWDFLVPSLISTRRCVTVDLPGHGDTHFVNQADRCDMKAVAQDLWRLLDRLNVRGCSIVGYSMGGRLALCMALMHPERVDRLVLESASPGLRTEEERVARRTQDDALSERLVTEDFDTFLRWWYDQPLFASLHQRPGAVEHLLAQRHANDPNALADANRVLGLGRQPSLWKAWATNQIPTLLIVGDQDARFLDVARAMAAQCPASHLHVVPGCGHNVHYEEPGTYSEVLKRFLQDA